ncbi:MAG: metal ABC transporter solute-binding protein, Zn/Mn family [Christensenellales bacterium]
MNMKKILSCLLAFILIAAAFSACDHQAPSASDPNSATNAGKFSIIATTFPQYDWIQQILGEKIEDVELTLLLDDGVDLHSYQPTVEDIAKISSCDMFIHVGGESDAWVHDALEAATNKNMIVINMMEVLGDKVKEEEIVEGMEDSHDHGHGEIDPDDIHDRPLLDWQGDWTTIEKALQSGALDEYVDHNAHENGNDFEMQKSAYAQRWKSEYETLTISDTSITFDGVSADYTYIGYRLVESDHGGSVWYGFEAQDKEAGVPLYIAFYDHGTGGGHDNDHGHEEDHDHGHESPHYHLRYGNESFVALTAIEGWSPTYFLSDATGEEIAETMSGHSHSHEHEDEHVWLSLKNAQILCGHIAEGLKKLDGANGSVYTSNTEAYNEKLAELDSAYQSTVDNATGNTLLFGDRFPFRYLVDDYGISYFAAFSGCSAETEASFETIVFLADKMDELALEHVMVIENADQSIASTVIESTESKGQNILVLDSMQSVTAQHVSSGTTYLSIMESNLEVLKKALS